MTAPTVSPPSDTLLSPITEPTNTEPTRSVGVALLSFDSDSSYDNPFGTTTPAWGTACVHIKAEQPDTPLALAHEFIVSRLAIALGLPAVAGEVVTLPNDHRRAWASFQVNEAKPHTAPANLQEFAEHFPELAAGIMVFDMWVGNSARSEENLLFAAEVGGWLVDHSQCFDTEVTPSLVADISPHSKHIKHWCERIQFFPSATIDAILNEAHNLALLKPRTQKGYRKFLRTRRDHIRQLITECTEAEQPEAHSTQKTLFFVED